MKIIAFRRNLFVGLLVIILPWMLIIPSNAQASTLHNLYWQTVDAYPNYKIAVILVTFPDNPPKTSVGSNEVWTKSSINGVLFSNANSMSAFFKETSEGAVSVTGSVFDNSGKWYTIDRPQAVTGSCDWSTYFTDAMQATDTDIDYTQFNTVMVFSPKIDCATGGLATSMPVPDTNGEYYGVAEIDGVLGTYPHHELGHLIGFGHANSWQCNPPGIMSGTNCREEEYADRYNIMGASSRMLELSAPQKEHFGWLKPEELKEVSANGDYTIQTYELSGTKPKVLKIPQARNADGTVSSWYYLEYRQPIGYDNVLNKPTLQELGVPNGALVHVGSSEGFGYASKLLDMTPGSLPGGRDIFEPALQLGSSYSDSVAGVSFGVLSRNATSMTIRVRFSAATLCEWKAPTVTAKAIKNSGKRGQELRYDLTVKNNSTLCGKQAIDLRTSKLPSGWKVTIDKATKKSISVVPGQSQKVTVRLTSPKNAKFPKYNVQIESKMKLKANLKKIATLQLTVKR